MSRFNAEIAGKTIVYGAFKGMGDLLSAAPVLRQELRAGHRIKLLCFPGKKLEELIELIDFGPERESLTILSLPVSTGLKGYRKFFKEAAQLRPSLIWISPHASRTASSWKIPLLLWMTKQLYWRPAVLAGTITERGSFLFNKRVPVDRNLPLMRREQTAYARLAGMVTPGGPLEIAFVSEVARIATEPRRYEVLIHPGANAQNRSWPLAHYAEMVKRLPPEYRLAVLGLPGDVEAMRRALPVERKVDFLTGSLAEALQHLARARVVLTMDSGNVHFANVLGVPAVALFGPCDPATVIAAGGSVLPIYERKFACQPCRAATCSQPEVYCMNSLSPAMVAETLVRVVERRDGARELLVASAKQA